MATVFYARVSTVDQTLEHQRIQAEAAGFRFDQVVADFGVSGVATALRDRTEGRRLFDLLRSGDNPRRALGGSAGTQLRGCD